MGNIAASFSRQLMNVTRFILILAAGCLVACSDRESADPAAAAAPPASAVPAAPASADAGSAPLSAGLAARLVRPHSPIVGARNAPVTIVEFLDPACEACRAFAPVIQQIEFLYPDDVRVVVRYAAFHEGSAEAVRLLAAAHAQGKFKPVLAALFDGQPEWASHGAPNLARAWELAGAAGLDLARARRDADSSAARDTLRIDGEDVVKLKVERTPTFFVNGRPLPAFGVEPLMKLVAEEVARHRAPAR
jgi:protein-disulfide isomerase